MVFEPYTIFFFFLAFSFTKVPFFSQRVNNIKFDDTSEILMESAILLLCKNISKYTVCLSNTSEYYYNISSTVSTSFFVSPSCRNMSLVYFKIYSVRVMWRENGFTLSDRAARISFSQNILPINYYLQSFFFVCYTCIFDANCDGEEVQLKFLKVMS